MVLRVGKNCNIWNGVDDRGGTGRIYGSDQMGFNKSNNTIALEVVEVNPFKYLCHLSLLFSASTNDSKLSHLSDYIQQLKVSSVSSDNLLKDKVEHHRKELCRYQQEITDKSQEIERLNTHLCNKVTEVTEKQNKLLLQEKERILKIKSDADRHLDRERRILERQMHDRVTELQNKEAALSRDNHELLRKKERLEVRIKEIQFHGTSNEQQIQQLTEEVSQLKKHNNKLMDNDQHLRDSGARQEQRLQVVESELTNTTAALTQVNHSLNTMQQQNITLERTTEELKHQLSKREANAEKLYIELQKSLEIIMKLRKRLQYENIQSNARGTALLEQEKILGEKNNKSSEMTSKLSQLKCEVEQLTETCKKLQEETNDKSEKIKEQEKTLKMNESNIGWLNKQLNKVDAVELVNKRSPLVEAYLSNSKITTIPCLSQASHHFASSTPLSTTKLSHLQPSLTKSSLHNTMSSIRTMEQIPPIPEEISPSEVDLRRTDKENNDGLHLKYFEATPIQSTNNPPVHGGLLRAEPQSVIQGSDVRGTTSGKLSRGTSKRGGKSQFNDGIRRGVIVGSKPAIQFQ